VWSYRDYYYIVRNEDMKQALIELEAIVLAERIKTKRIDMTWIEENFIRGKDEKPADRGVSVAIEEEKQKR